MRRFRDIAKNTNKHKNEKEISEDKCFLFKFMIMVTALPLVVSIVYSSIYFNLWQEAIEFNNDYWDLEAHSHLDKVDPYDYCLG